MLIDTSHNPCLLSGDAHTFTILVCCLAIHTHSHTLSHTHAHTRTPFLSSDGTQQQVRRFSGNSTSSSKEWRQ